MAREMSPSRKEVWYHSLLSRSAVLSSLCVHEIHRLSRVLRCNSSLRPPSHTARRPCPTAAAPPGRSAGTPGRGLRAQTSARVNAKLVRGISMLVGQSRIWELLRQSVRRDPQACAGSAADVLHPRYDPGHVFRAGFHN